MQSFRKFLESYGDDFEIDGEYWIDDSGNAQYADGDIGDYNHEAHVIEMMQSSIANTFGLDFDRFHDWNKIVKEIAQSYYQEQREKAIKRNDAETVQQLDELWNDGEYDEMAEKAMHDQGYDDKDIGIAYGRGDARLYAMEKWGWKRVAENSIETWRLTKHDMDAIVSGVWEILTGQIDSTEDAEQVELYIYVMSTKQEFDTNLAELDQMASRKHIPMPADRLNSTINMQNQAGNDYMKDKNLKLMHPYYANKKFPFADWNKNLK